MRKPRNLRVQIRMTQRATSPFTVEHDGRRGVASPEDVLGEIEPRVRKESRARHFVEVHDDALAHCAANSAEGPDFTPELSGPVDREAIQVLVAGELKIESGAHVSHERRHPRSRHSIGRGLP